MCLSEPLPPENYTNRILDVIRNTVEPTEGDETDIYATALTGQPLDNDYIAAMTFYARLVGNSLNDIDHDLAGTFVEDDGQVPAESEYEEIFASFVARRADREFTAPTRKVQDFVRHWLDSVRHTPDPSFEVGEPPNMMPDFPKLIRKHLPLKLDFDSWIGKIAFGKLWQKQAIRSGNLLMWETWMGTSDAHEGPGRPANVFFMKHYKTFLGVGGEGRPVWRQNKWGVPHSTGSKEAFRQDEVTELIRETENSLISLSIQIANWLAYWIISEHAHDSMHSRENRGLTGGDVVMAVVEILGDEWFDLPFDDDGKLKDWKLMRSLPMSEEEYFHILDE